MERLLNSADIAERYQCSLQCARNYMRRMEHQESPLRVTESAIRAWELSRTMFSRTNTERMIVPRTR